MTAGAEEPNALVQLERPGGAQRAQPARHRDRALRRADRREPEPLAVARLRRRRGQRSAVAAVPGRLLLQDLHVAGGLVEDALRAAHPPRRRPRPGARPARSRPLPAPPRPLRRAGGRRRPGRASRRRWRPAAAARASSCATRGRARRLAAGRERRARRVDGRTATPGCRSVGPSSTRCPRSASCRAPPPSAISTTTISALAERVTDHLPMPPANLPRQRLWQVRAKQVVLATGAIERPLVFADNDRPGIMLASAARDLSQPLRRAARPARGARHHNDGAYAAALDLEAPASTIAAIVDLRARADGRAAAAARRAPASRSSRGAAVVGTERPAADQQAWISAAAADGSVVTGEPHALRLRLPAHLGRLDPVRASVLAVARQAAFDDERGRLRAGPVGRSRSARPAPAAAPMPRRLLRRRRSRPVPRPPQRRRLQRRHADSADGATSRELAPAAADLGRAAAGRRRAAKAFVDFQNDVTAKDLGLAVREGFQLDRARQALHHHRHGDRPGQDLQHQRPRRSSPTRCGMPIPAVGTDDLPPALHAGHLRRPRRPARAASCSTRSAARRSTTGPTAQGAVFEDVGQWKRARYFPQRRRGHARRGRARMPWPCARASASSTPRRSARSRCQGPDARRVPEPRLHQRLDQARARPLPLRHDAARGRLHLRRRRRRRGSAPDRFHVTTTTGGAARVLRLAGGLAADRMAASRGLLTSVTEQWAVIAVVRARSRATCSQPLVDGHRPRRRGVAAHGGARRARSAGVPARLFRISFTGELGLRGQRARRLWRGALGGAVGGRPDHRHHAPTAPRRCTCCAPRRATSSSARRPTAR